MKPKNSVTLKEAIELINERAEQLIVSTNNVYINSIYNQIRAIIWLFTGKDPGMGFKNIKDVYKILKIPFHSEEKNGQIYIIPDLNGAVAQSGEHLVCNQKVGGS